MADAPLTRVKTLKYLGVVFSEDMGIRDDVDRVLASFLKQFNGAYHKFNFLYRECMAYIFRTYTSSFYGIESWYGRNITTRSFSKLEVAWYRGVPGGGFGGQVPPTFQSGGDIISNVPPTF